MFPRCKSWLILLAGMVSACSQEQIGWDAQEQTVLEQELAETLWRTAGQPPPPVVLVWGKNGKALDSFSDQVDAFRSLADVEVLVMEVDPYGLQTDMMSVPVEALESVMGSPGIISLVGPVTGSVPSSFQYVCLLPSQWLQGGVMLTGLSGAVIPTTQDLPGLQVPAQGSELFRSQYRVFQAQ